MSHGHFDHFGDAPALAKMNNAPVWGPAGLQQTMLALNILPPELAPRFNKGGTIAPWGPSGVKITGTHAEHSSEFVWMNPATGKNEVHVGSEPMGFIIVMDPKDAAYATREWLKPKYAVPMHYGTTPRLKGTPEEYIKALGDAPVKVLPIAPGDKLSF